MKKVKAKPRRAASLSASRAAPLVPYNLSEHKIVLPGTPILFNFTIYLRFDDDAWEHFALWYKPLTVPPVRGLTVYHSTILYGLIRNYL